MTEYQTLHLRIWELIFLFIADFLSSSEYFFFSAKFHLRPSSGDFTATSDRNDESCNRIPSNYCVPELLSIAPRFWPSKPLAGLGRIWNRYLLTMLSWNHRDSTPLSAAPWAPKDTTITLLHNNTAWHHYTTAYQNYTTGYHYFTTAWHHYMTA